MTGPVTRGHVVSDMSVTIQLDLPEALVKEAKANGLLESRRLGELLNEELRRGRAAGVRAVIDNNVLVSGLLWGDKPGRVLAAVAEGHVHIFLSEELLAELREVLLKRLGLS